MKLQELFEGEVSRPTDFEDFKREVRKVWGEKVVIKQIEKEGVDGPLNWWCAKTRDNWEEYPHDASMSVAQFVTRDGKVDDRTRISTPDQWDKNKRSAAKLSYDRRKIKKAERKAASKTKTDFFVGQRVHLLPVDGKAEEGEVTRVFKLDQMLWVLIDKKYRDEEDDDGIREVPFDQVVPLTKKPE